MKEISMDKVHNWNWNQKDAFFFFNKAEHFSLLYLSKLNS